MKILIVTNMYPSKQKAYAGIFVKNQYNEIKRILPIEDTVDIFFMKRQFTSKLGSILKYFKAFANFVPYLFRRYDIVHLHFFHPLIYLVWLYKKIHPNCKVVVTFHGIDITDKVHANNKKHFQKLAKAVDYTIPVGITLAKMVSEKLKLSIGSILPVGVNNDVFFKEQSIKKSYDFIFIGSFTERKGIDTVIEAIQLLNQRDISFCFCGSGKYKEQLEDLQKSKFNITIKQNQTQPELRKLLNQSRVFILMSRNEGFPTATIESMYCGVPVITSDIPQFREQISEGTNGFIVPLGDAVELSKTIKNIHEIKATEYHKLSEGALNSFKELSLQNVCKQIYNIYKDLLKSA
ncbi:glycosyltransferase family 4 protein [Mangrovimonas spongiae]|uniref:Glycosyltransferase n=1 Tax=Mangrovimonas spongiae TaxID=2494697 RepID=A0A428K518_9FLAO|nr:glycosyltransferase family 4 protein [Mangrovimonas spongiae]RSK41509.1 glycosyltransferase [Mangrovimonas spongiae]